MEHSTFVGLDVRKSTTSLTIAESSRGGEVRFLGEIPSAPEALHRLVERLKRNHRRLSFCYEAGPCGYGVHGLLSDSRRGCVVVAPSLVPSRPGRRVKTSRRDAITLAKLHRAGEWTLGLVPDAAHVLRPRWLTFTVDLTAGELHSRYRRARARDGLADPSRGRRTSTSDASTLGEYASRRNRRMR